MTTVVRHQKRSIWRLIPTIGSLCVTSIGLAVLLGWLFDIEILKKIAPTWTFMAPNTAVTLILIGLVLLILESKHVTGWYLRFVFIILSLVLLFQLLTISEYLFNWNFGIDSFLFHNSVISYGAAYPGRMAPPTLVCLTLITLALMQFAGSVSWMKSLAIWLVFAASSFAGLQLLIYFYDSSTLTFTSDFNQMAVHTAIAVEALSVSILLAHPSRKIFRTWVGNGVGNAILRRILPVSILIPIIAGWLGFLVETKGTTDTIVIVALGVTLTIGGLIILSGVSARLLNQMELALQRSEARYRSLVDSQLDVIARSDIDGNLTFVNDSYCRTFGKSREELLGKTFSPYVLPEDFPTILDTLNEIKSPPYRKQTETRHLTPTGIRWFSWDNAAVVDENGVIIEFQGVGRDITERKTAEAALRESETRFRIIIEAAPIGIGFARQRQTLYANRRYLEMFGYEEPEEANGHAVMEHIAPQCREQLAERYRRRAQGELVPTNYESIGLRKDGSQFPFEVWVDGLEFSDGPAQIAFLLDISERKKADEALHESETQFRSTFEQAAVGIAHVAPDGHFLMINARFCDLLGYSREEMLTKTFQEVTHPDDLDNDLKHVRQILAREIDTYSLEKRYYRKD